MENVKQWALCVTFSALAAGVVFMLSPRGTTEKAMRATVSVFLIFSVTASLIPALSSLSFQSTVGAQTVTDTELTQVMNKQLIDAAQTAVRQAILDEVEAMGITPRKIEITADIDESGGIFIKEAVIVFDGTDYVDLQSVERNIKGTLGVDAVCRTEG